MQKSQELPFERGAGSGWYDSYSTSTNIYRPEFPDLKDLYMQFGIGLSNANTYRIVPAFVGQQTFSSSQCPRPQFNNCTNYKVRGVELPVTYCNLAYSSSTSYYVARLTRMWSSYYANSSLVVPTNPNNYWIHCDGAQRRAWWSMQPRFEGEFSALNFIYELKDFKDIAKHLSKISPSKVVNTVKSLKRKLAYAQKRVAQGSTSSTLIRTANAATKTVAEVHLAKVFAVDPTIRDLTILHGQLITLLNEKQQEFFDRGRDVQSTHYTEYIDESSDLTAGRYNAFWYQTGTHAKVVFTATMEYRYEYAMRSWFEALKRYYGLNVNASVVWNALPFSFVLDYFLKVGQAIDFMNTDPNVELRMKQYCESLLSEATSGYSLTGVAGSSVLVNGGADLKNGELQSPAGTFFSGYKGTWYVRRVTTPNKGAALPRLSLPSSGQVTNLVALVRAMW